MTATTAKKTTKPKRNLQIALDLSALRRTDPMGWRDKIFAAFREKKGNAVHAASLLGIGHRTMIRYLEEDPTLSAGVEKIRESAKEQRAKDRGEEA